jgi:hypothetical protein
MTAPLYVRMSAAPGVFAMSRATLDHRRRRVVMEAWARHVTGAGAQVVRMVDRA